MLSVGERRRISLPPAGTGNWRPLAASTAGVVTLVQTGGYPGTDPVVATVTGLAPGRTTLTTMSDVACLHSTPRCLPPQRGWVVTILVR